MSLDVIICDDAAFIREVLAQICRERGHNVVAEAKDGEEIIALAKQHHPQVIFMDMVMPKKNGVDATKEVLEIDPNISIIACTTVTEDFLRRKALQAGCLTYITKPFTKADILSALDFVKSKMKGRKHG